MFRYILFLLLISSIQTCKILALSGGGAHGAFEVGVLNSIKDHQWDIITGISAGSINAMFISLFNESSQIYAIEELKNLWFSLSDSSIYTRNWNPLDDKSWYDSSPLNKTLINTARKFGAKIHRDIIIGASNMNYGHLDIFQKNNLTSLYHITQSVMASSAIPFFFPPIPYNGHVYADGGVVSNELILPAIDKCINEYNDKNITIEVVICSPTIEYKSTKELMSYHLYGIVERAFEIIQNSWLNHQIHFSKNNECINLAIPITLYESSSDYKGSLLDFSQKSIRYSYEMGYKHHVVKKYYYCL